MNTMTIAQLHSAYANQIDPEIRKEIAENILKMIEDVEFMELNDALTQSYAQATNTKTA